MRILTAEPKKTRIGWIGTGVMGRWMCQHTMGRDTGPPSITEVRTNSNRCWNWAQGRRHAKSGGRAIGHRVRDCRVPEGRA